MCKIMNTKRLIRKLPLFLKYINNLVQNLEISGQSSLALAYAKYTRSSLQILLHLQNIANLTLDNTIHLHSLYTHTSILSMLHLAIPQMANPWP